jgi:hypothetical protein
MVVLAKTSAFDLTLEGTEYVKKDTKILMKTYIERIISQFFILLHAAITS